MISFYLPNVSVHEFPDKLSIRNIFSNHGKLLKVDFGNTYGDYGDVFLHFKSITSKEFLHCLETKERTYLYLAEGKFTIMPYIKKEKNIKILQEKVQTLSEELEHMKHLYEYRMWKRDQQWKTQMHMYFKHVMEKVLEHEKEPEKHIGLVEKWFLPYSSHEKSF